MKLPLKRVSAEYDFALLDTRPLLAMMDERACGPSILVAREGVTRMGELNETVKRFNQSGSKVTGVVFNAVRHRPGKYGHGNVKYRYTSEAYKQYA